jgi:hypothetical protein
MPNKKQRINNIKTNNKLQREIRLLKNRLLLIKQEKEYYGIRRCPICQALVKDHFADCLSDDSYKYHYEQSITWPQHFKMKIDGSDKKRNILDMLYSTGA